MPSLTVLKGANQGMQYSLTPGKKNLLGRNQDCDIVINIPAVSREHAVIVAKDGQFFLEDLKSRNFTFLNNEKIDQPSLLKHEDQIKICDNIFVFQDGTTKAPLPEYMTNEAQEEEEEHSSTVEATIHQAHRQVALEAQPAEKLKLLLDISAELSQTLNLDQVLPKIVEQLFQVFRQADRSFVIFAEEGGKKLIPKVIQTRRKHEETTARFSRNIVRGCLKERAAILSEDASSDKRFDMSQSIAEYRIRSVMVVPLIAQSTEEAFGVILLDTQDRAKKFTTDDLKMLTAVSGQAAIALENAQLHQSVVNQATVERELALATEVQMNFLPKTYPEIPGYSFCAFYEPARQVGGDYYDFIPLPGGKVAITTGDVAGKGVPAALLMAKVSSDTRFLLLTQPNSAVAITKLNEFMQGTGLIDRFITLESMVLDPETHEVTIVNAGHMSPVIYRKATGELTEALGRDDGGLPLGVLDSYEYESYSIHLEPGDVLVTFSDGLTEAPNQQNEEFQMERLYEALRSGPTTPEAMVNRLVEAVKLHSQGMKAHDDLTVVAFGRAE